MNNVKYLRNNELLITQLITQIGLSVEDVKEKLTKFKSWYIHQLKLINDDEHYETFQKTWEGIINLISQFTYGVSNTVTLGCGKKFKKDIRQLMLMEI